VEASFQEEDLSCRGLSTRTEDDVEREERRKCTEEPSPFFAGPAAQALRAQSRTRRVRDSEPGAPIPKEPTSPLTQPRFNNVRRQMRPCRMA
jgi:hypothetical protein